MYAYYVTKEVHTAWPIGDYLNGKILRSLTGNLTNSVKTMIADNWLLV